MSKCLFIINSERAEIALLEIITLSINVVERNWEVEEPPKFSDVEL